MGNFLNDNNFIRFYTDLTQDFSEFYHPKLIERDVVRVMINLRWENPGPDTFNDVYLVDEDQNLLFNIGLLTTVLASRAYTFEWTVPGIPEGKYFFALTDGATVRYISNPVCFIKNSSSTTIIKYRNTKNIFRFKYELELGWFNQIRIDGRLIWPQFGDDSTSYNSFEGETIRSHAFMEKIDQANFFDFDEPSHQAMFSALVHDQIFFDDVQYKKPPGNAYSIAWADDEYKKADSEVGLKKVSENESIII